MHYLNTVCLIINGSPSEVFKAKRGLHQGNPLSPLLFVIGMKYLSRSLLCLMHNPQFKPYPRCRQLKLNHLCFADDLMFFCTGDLTSIKLLCYDLEGFAQMCDLCPNLAKFARGMQKNPIRNIRSGLPGIRFSKPDNLPDLCKADNPDRVPCF